MTLFDPERCQLLEFAEYKHHIRSACTIHQKPGQPDSVTPKVGCPSKSGYLFTVLQHDRILSDQIDATNVAIEVNGCRANLAERRLARYESIYRYHDNLESLPSVVSEPSKDS